MLSCEDNGGHPAPSIQIKLNDRTLTENIGGASVELSPDELRDLDLAAAKITVQGARYPEHLQKLVGR